MIFRLYSELSAFFRSVFLENGDLVLFREDMLDLGKHGLIFPILEA